MNKVNIKRVIQVTFFFFIFSTVSIHFLQDKGIVIPIKTFDLHATCPFGAVETLGRLIIADKFIPKTHESNFWVLLSVTGSTILFGAFFCGWLCPLGSIQEWIGKLGKRLFKKKYNNIPIKIDKLLGNLRYVVLLLIVLQTTRHLSLMFVKIDPYYALFHFWTGEALPTAILVLFLVLLSSLLVQRPWCRWFCPFGAVQGILQLISPWKIRRTNKCISCNKCSKACPMKIDVANIEYVLDTRCNKCGECLDSCPIQGAIDHNLPISKGLSIKNRLTAGIIVVSLFILPIVIAEKIDLFKTSNKIVVKEGALKTSDIKGSMTIKEVANGFDVEKNRLYELLELSQEIPGDTKLRDIEDEVESLTLPVIRTKLETL
ncbi:MAG: 4Fe-4S binding protein [Spirochaetaceae bacterium]